MHHLGLELIHWVEETDVSDSFPLQFNNYKSSPGTLHMSNYHTLAPSLHTLTPCDPEILSHCLVRDFITMIRQHQNWKLERSACQCVWSIPGSQTCRHTRDVPDASRHIDILAPAITRKRNHLIHLSQPHCPSILTDWKIYWAVLRIMLCFSEVGSWLLTTGLTWRIMQECDPLIRAVRLLALKPKH